FDNTHPNYAGDIGVGINEALAARVQRADLVIAVGARLGETTTAGYTLLPVPTLHATFVHVHADTDELGKVYHPDLCINAGMAEFAQAASALAPDTRAERAAWAADANADYRDTLVPTAMPGALNLADVITHLRQTVAANTVITNGAGNYPGWIHRFYAYPGFRTQLAPASGVMGYGIPAACAAAIVHPDRPVICFAGDGCFLMNSQELATARQYRLPIVF